MLHTRARRQQEGNKWLPYKRREIWSCVCSSQCHYGFPTPQSTGQQSRLALIDHPSLKLQLPDFANVTLQTTVHNCSVVSVGKLGCPGRVSTQRSSTDIPPGPFQPPFFPGKGAFRLSVSSLLVLEPMDSIYAVFTGKPLIVMRPATPVQNLRALVMDRPGLRPSSQAPYIGQVKPRNGPHRVSGLVW